MIITISHHVAAQISVPKKTQQFAPVIINEYANQYPNIPALPKIYEQWYYTPKQIAQYITFTNINPTIKYFGEDDSPYFEFVKDGVKGRLFLKVVGGPLYQILDLYFVPYFDAISDTTVKSTPDTNKDIIEPPMQSTERDELFTDNASVKDDDTKKDIGKNSVVPLFTQRFQGNGSTLYLDVISFNKKGRRNILTRYNSKKLVVFSEQYAYTSKGALQRLVRTYADGSTERFVYYFNTTGLKEVFNQNIDGSSYTIRYTKNGDLAYKRIFDTNNILTYEKVNNYLDNILLTEETDMIKGIYSHSRYVDNRLIAKKTYTLVPDPEDETPKKDDVTAESVILEDKQSDDDTTIVANIAKDQEDEKNTVKEKADAVAKNKKQNRDDATKIIAGREFILSTEETFTYNQQGNEIDTNSLGILHERNTVTEYDAKGTIVRIKNFFDGSLDHEIVYSKDDIRTRIYYLHNDPVLRVYYEQGIKIKEEVLEHGEVIEVR